LTGLLVHASVARLALDQMAALGASGENPCDEDKPSVCLDLLYGLGDSDSLSARVLGIVALTGIGVIALIVIALSLSATGSGFLIAAGRQAGVTADGRG
jgi:hypothetical protein